MEYIKTPKVDNVGLVDSTNDTAPVKGTLHLTTTHLIFSHPSGTKETWILYGHIYEVEKLPLTARGSAVRIRTKNFRNITFFITRDRECTDVYDTIIKFSNPVDVKDLYAFDYNPNAEQLEKGSGWNIYDPMTEFQRMEVPKTLWVQSTLNENYKLCETYPNVLFFPASVSGVLVKECAQFRSKNRLPSLSYFYKETQTSLCRCSQPLTGLNNRSNEDEAMLQAIIKSTPDSNRMYIVDTRPKINAMANRAAGKGYENTANYENIDFHFIGIENIHVMRQSLQKMIELFDRKDLSTSSFLRGLDESGWLKHIKSVLDTSIFIAKAMYSEKRSVLVHCSDGWDRTAQTCSLAELMLDPHYRTIHGFQILIEKEWLSFGYKFIHRCGLLSGDPKEVSPIFTQFLEAVWQLSIQFPTAFQFNERFLLDLHEHVYSCQFGTFLGNCEKERKDRKLDERTYSLWGYMWQNLPDYVNPFYTDRHEVLRPSSSPQQLRFWRSLYNRFHDDVHPREPIGDYVCSLSDHNDSLKDHIRLLQKKIEELENVDKYDSEKNVTENALEESPHLEKQQSNKVTDTSISDARNKAIENRQLEPNEGKTIELENASEECNTTSQEDSIMGDTQISAFALEWDSFRGVSQCSCGKPLQTLSRKYHCWNCGKVFCAQCVQKTSQLPGHYSGNQVPVCKGCYKTIRK